MPNGKALGREPFGIRGINLFDGHFVLFLLWTRLTDIILSSSQRFMARNSRVIGIWLVISVEEHHYGAIASTIQGQQTIQVDGLDGIQPLVRNDAWTDKNGSLAIWFDISALLLFIFRWRERFPCFETNGLSFLEETSHSKDSETSNLDAIKANI